MTCEEFKEMAPAYALGILDEAERTTCTRHLGQDGPHRGCPEAVGEARQVTERLAVGVAERVPSPGVWQAIETRIAGVPPVAVDCRRRLREVGGWVLAATVVGFYVFSMRVDLGRRAAALDGGRSTARDALALMTVPGTRSCLSTVQPRARPAPEGPRSSSIPPSAARSCSPIRFRPRPHSGCGYGGARGPDLPIPLAPVPIVAADGIAAADLGASLFEPRSPDHLVISADDPGAKSPGDVLLTAETR